MINGVMIMRKFAEKAYKAVKLGLIMGVFIFCLADTAAAAQAVGEAVERCINVVIPSLFAMLAVSALIIRSGALSIMPQWAGKLSRRLFGMEGSIFPIFTFGMFAGYPVGVKMLCEQYGAGNITKRRAELLSGLCFGAGPAFIFGCISRQLYGSDRAGTVILISNAAANVLIALIVSPLLRRSAEAAAPERSLRISAEMLTDSVIRSGRAMADICIMITAFSVFTAFLTVSGTAAAVGELLGKLPDLDRISGEATVAAVLDVTNMGKYPSGDWLLLPYISGLTAFGGVCVIFQISALTAGKISLKPFILMRSAAGAVSFGICRLIMPYFMEGETVAAAAVNVRSSSSPIPSVMLVIMTAMLMCEFGKKGNKRAAEST